jgi:dTDP-4-dehydrorhamnose reductase
MPMRRRRPRRLLVTGGSGFLGRHIVAGPASEPWEVLAPSSQALDLRDAESVRSTLDDLKPTAIIHTAYRRGDRRAIVDATRHVAGAAEHLGCRLVNVSTDAVFPGRLEPYTEADPPAPVHDYGREKAEAEQIVAATCPTAVTVRTSLLYGRSELSSHELAVRDVISGRSRMAFFTDEIRCPALAEDLAASLVELAERPEITGMLHITGPDAFSRADLATMTARRHGWDATKLRFSTIEESDLTRPRRVVLDSSHARGYGIAVRGPLVV